MPDRGDSKLADTGDTGECGSGVDGSSGADKKESRLGVTRLLSGSVAGSGEGSRYLLTTVPLEPADADEYGELKLSDCDAPRGVCSWIFAGWRSGTLGSSMVSPEMDLSWPLLSFISRRSTSRASPP